MGRAEKDVRRQSEYARDALDRHQRVASQRARDTPPPYKPREEQQRRRGPKRDRKVVDRWTERDRKFFDGDIGFTDLDFEWDSDGF